MTGAKQIDLPHYRAQIKCALGWNRSVTCPHPQLCRILTWIGDFSLLAVEWRDRLQLHTAEPSATYIITGKPAASSPSTDSPATRPWLLMRCQWVALMVGGWVWPVGRWNFQCQSLRSVQLRMQLTVILYNPLTMGCDLTIKWNSTIR